MVSKSNLDQNNLLWILNTPTNKKTGGNWTVAIKMVDIVLTVNADENVMQFWLTCNGRLNYGINQTTITKIIKHVTRSNESAKIIIEGFYEFIKANYSNHYRQRYQEAWCHVEYDATN